MRTYLYLLFTLIALTLSAQSKNRAILEANDLIAQKKYFSAYEILDGSDPNNQSPEIAIAKTNLLLHYYISTDLHYKFGLKDLTPNESLSDYEQSNLENNIEFHPDSILIKLFHQYPEEYSLLKTLGDYFYEIHLQYPNNEWFLNDSIVCKNVKTNYLSAFEYNVYDYLSLFRLGYMYLLEKNNQEAIKFLEKSIKLNSKYPLSYYNLAYAYFNLFDYNKALELASKSYEMQTNSFYKAEVARLLGIIYEKLNQKEEAYSYFLSANKLLPKDYHTLIPILRLGIILNKPEYKEITSEIFLLAPENPTVYKDIMNAYVDANKRNEFIEFLENEKYNYHTDNKVLANICFYTALELYEEHKWVKAKNNFEKARILFRQIYNENHNIFNVINSYTDVLRNKY
ncbi:MAG: hypothetical protein CR965_00555 [Paludibacter sp.]|nr:MAG: hypothetical protein CR965_00555 [Paludibacter sp.]